MDYECSKEMLLISKSSEPASSVVRRTIHGFKVIISLPCMILQVIINEKLSKKENYLLIILFVCLLKNSYEKFSSSLNHLRKLEYEIFLNRHKRDHLF